MRVNFISNLELSETSGGWSGINVAIHEQLSKEFDVRFVGPINPVNDHAAKLISKVRRMNGQPGAFHFFSSHRLQKISKLVEQGVDKAADCDFFHGQTPWILYESERPYFAYTDACFSTYVDIYHERSEFSASDLKRICASEARWLARASRVFFGTRWALERALADYQISSSNLSAVGAGGSMSVPEQDLYEGGTTFLFISLDFTGKGGPLCAEAFERVQELVPDACLSIVGERPPDSILKMPGVHYEGLLRKSIPVELTKLKTLYARAFALIHPTSADLQPLVISEAGYFGCPSITARNFGIPELIEDGVTGLLVEPPLTAEVFAEQMLRLCRDKTRYLSMRRAVRTRATKGFTWQVVGNRIRAEMRSALVEVR